MESKSIGSMGFDRLSNGQKQGIIVADLFLRALTLCQADKDNNDFVDTILQSMSGLDTERPEFQVLDAIKKLLIDLK
jgi:hypothetical protein